MGSEPLPGHLTVAKDTQERNRRPKKAHAFREQNGTYLSVCSVTAIGVDEYREQFEEKPYTPDAVTCKRCRAALGIKKTQ